MEDSVIVHASCVAFDAKAALIRGKSGSGKSTLALQLMALGAALVSDDRTAIARHGERLIARPAPNISALIEARGVGILSAAPPRPAPLALIVDLDRPETERLPPYREDTVLEVAIPVLHKSNSPAFAAAIRQYLCFGRAHPTPDP